ncbi:gephyrin-like isoform X2 [Camponotus floridanus]|uniref:gephyrin-like isoform X2 n=1 Tax=Camponotus floridanus TaxID=104421 RepID=UPI000DC6A389|nr:gephyrin-like isoform X2 [Camponotus floridanus]
MIKKYTNIVEVTTRLESKFHQIMCRMLNETLIINLFGRSYKEAVTCIDEIVIAIEHKIKLTHQGKIKQDITSSSNNNTDQIDENKIKFYKKAMLSPYTEKGNDVNKKKSQSFLSSDKSIEKVDDNQTPKYREKFSRLSLEKLDVTSGGTISAESSSFETIKTQKPLSANITMEELSIASQEISDSKSSSSKITNKELSSLNGTIGEHYLMITVKDALLKIKQIVNDGAQKRTYEVINTYNAHGRILAEAVFSQCDLPAFRVATKHGYAVLASDGEGVRIVLHKTTSDSVSLKPGTCLYVKNGERVPDEATAVVRIKDVRRIVNDTARNLILIKIKPEFGRNIKNIGSDISKGNPIIPPFTRIGPAELGLLTVTGRKDVRVVKPVSIGILSIGDFLEEPRKSLRPGYVYDSNRISLIALLKDKDFNSIVDFGIVTEDTQSIKMKIENALKQVDVLVTIGCSNDDDVLKPILRNNFRATIHFGKIFLKPGKSTTFATCIVDDEMKYFVCLPKNPVSVFISAHLFLLPILNGLHCMFEMPRKIPTRIHQQYTLHTRPRAVWATLEWNEWENFARAFSSKNFTSDKLPNYQGANALLLFPSKTEVNCKMLFVPACLIK